LLGFALFTVDSIYPRNHIKDLVYLCGGTYSIRGAVVSEPVFKGNKTSFVMRAEELSSRNSITSCCGDILVCVNGRHSFYYGQDLSITGKLCRPYGGTGPGSRSYRSYLYGQGIFYILRAEAGIFVQKASLNPRPTLKGFAFCLKDKARKMLYRHLSPLAASVLEAMVLGEKRNIPFWLYNSMIKTGTVHILVVSGFNVGIVACVVILFLKLLRLPRRPRACIAFGLLIIYCLMTGASTPVVRATIMAAFFMYSYLVRREPDIYNSLGLAALFILCWDPHQLFDPSFQLSFASVVSIVYLYPKIKSVLRLNDLKKGIGNYLISGLLVSLSAWLGTMGFIAHYFRIFSFVTVLANIFIVPLAALITLSGFALLAMEVLIPRSAYLFASSCELLVNILVNLNTFLVHIPGACVYF
jgi:competence protein ComEC